METQPIFVSGLIIKPPRENAPSFVKCTISIKTEELVAFLGQHTKPDGWLNIDVCEARDGVKWYGKLNTFQPRAQQQPTEDQIDNPF